MQWLPFANALSSLLISPIVKLLNFWLFDSNSFCLHQLQKGIRSVHSLSHVRLFATPWIAVQQASLSITNSWSSLKLMSIKSVMPSSHLILCRPLFLLPPIPPSIRVFSNESTLCMRWPKYWSFSLIIIPSKEHPRLISFIIQVYTRESTHGFANLSSCRPCARPRYKTNPVPFSRNAQFSVWVHRDSYYLQDFQSYNGDHWLTLPTRPASCDMFSLCRLLWCSHICDMVGIGLILWMRNSRLREMLWAGITSCKCLRWDQTAGLSQLQSVLATTTLARWRRGANWYVEMKRTRIFTCLCPLNVDKIMKQDAAISLFFFFLLIRVSLKDKVIGSK